MGTSFTKETTSGPRDTEISIEDHEPLQAYAREQLELRSIANTWAGRCVKKVRHADGNFVHNSINMTMQEVCHSLTGEILE
jgi:hypothetical protein